MNTYFHSVTLDTEKCKGCVNCIKSCPTEAIRVRNGKAYIISERCIDCGECIKVCPNHAKKASYDPLSLMDKFEYKIALPAPALYGQFNNLDDIDLVLNGLIAIGFDDVFEVSKAAELISDATRRIMHEGLVKKPVISSACPAVNRIIRVRFPDLCDNVLPIQAPMELAAALAKKEAHKKTGLPMEKIGAFFISPCAAKVTDVKKPIGRKKSKVDGVFAISDMFPFLFNAMTKVDKIEPFSASGIIGVGWASSGGESSALLNEKYLAADGIQNVIRVLEDIEDESLSEIDFIELNACSGGCVGGVLTVENPYVAKARIQRLRKYLPVACNHIEGHIPKEIPWSVPLEYNSVLKLAENLGDAVSIMAEIDRVEHTLPGIDCGSCGAPSCRALAEDIVRGEASVNDCVFKLRDQMERLAKQISEINDYIPAPFRKTEEPEKEKKK